MEITLLNGHNYETEPSVLDVRKLKEHFPELSGFRLAVGDETLIIRLDDNVKTYKVSPPKPQPAAPVVSAKPPKCVRREPTVGKKSKAARLAEAQKVPKCYKTQDSQTTLKQKGRKLRKLREEKGWTQAELAAKAQIHPTSIGQMERGNQNFDGKCGASLAVVLDTNW